MSKCKYHAIINKIQTVICNYSFIVNESGEEIVFYVDEAKEYNFQSPYELKYIVDTAGPTCETYDKHLFSATIKAVTLSSDTQVNLIDKSKFRAVFEKQPIYRSEIKCSSIDLQSLHTFFASSALLESVFAGSTSIILVDPSGFAIDMNVLIDAGTSIEEKVRIVSINPLVLKDPLQFDHPAGAPVGQIKSDPSPTPSRTPVPTRTPSVTPSITPTITTTNSITPTNTSTFIPTQTPTVTPSHTPTASQTPTPSNTNTATPAVTSSSTPDPTQTPTLTSTATPTVTSSSTPDPTQTPTLTSTATPTVTSSSTPDPTQTPTLTNTVTPTVTSSSPPPSVEPCGVLPADLPMILCGPTSNPTTPTQTPTATATPTPTNTCTPSPTPTVQTCSTLPAQLPMVLCGD